MLSHLPINSQISSSLDYQLEALSPKVPIKTVYSCLSLIIAIKTPIISPATILIGAILVIHYMYEEEEEERQQITIFITIDLVGVDRQLTFATFCNTTRLFTIGCFQDNQHYSHLESLLIQNSPKEEQARFQVHARIQMEWKSERKKVLEKISEYSPKIHEEKMGKGEVQLQMTFLLKKGYNMYNKELEDPKLRIVLQKLIELVNLERDSSNKSQFDLKLINLRSNMMLDKATINALQIFSKQMQKKSASNNVNTLYDIFNKCKTSFGTRCLKRWMKQPLQNEEEIQSRLDRIQFFTVNPSMKNLIQNQLKKLPDLDKLYFIFYKVASGKKVRCEVSDLIKLYRVVESLIMLVRNLGEKELSDPIIVEIYESINRNVDVISKVSKMIEKGIDMNGPRDNLFYVKPETQQSLTAIMKQKMEIEAEINQQVQGVAKHLRVDVQKSFSNTHKYILQANKKEAINKVKETEGYKYLTAKQTRITFVTARLTKLCEKLRFVEEDYKNEQQILLKKMFQLIAGYYPIMEELSFILSELDVLTTVATVVITSTSGVWCRPTIGPGIICKDMRHPLVKNCIPNDCELTTHKTVVLTGPNMGGKSTYIRTIGVCTYLAHIGFFVPASEFQTQIVDAVITRVGASDLQIKGISTFMSEMLESSCMLETATKNSLVLIDELGRGTSTCEGFGIAWAICEHLHTNISPFCLFATHFHEMTRMAEQIKGVKNMYTTCHIESGSLKLEYKVEEGKMQKSYGIEVMKILEFPPEVVKVAEEYLKYYEQDNQADTIANQLSDQVKGQVVRIYSEMESVLRQSPEGHEDIKKSYRLKLQAVMNG